MSRLGSGVWVSAALTAGGCPGGEENCPSGGNVPGGEYVPGGNFLHASETVPRDSILVSVSNVDTKTVSRHHSAVYNQLPQCSDLQR